jgi:hypothetical protein
MKSISDDSAGGTRSELALSRGWPVIISHFSLWEGSLLVCILTVVRTQSASNGRSGQSPFSEIGVPGDASTLAIRSRFAIRRVSRAISSPASSSVKPRSTSGLPRSKAATASGRRASATSVSVYPVPCEEIEKISDGWLWRDAATKQRHWFPHDRLKASHDEARDVYVSPRMISNGICLYMPLPA